MTIYHKHHIIPKHMGGSDDSSNLVVVTIEQHALLHKQLWEDFGNWQDEIAWKGLSKMIDRQEIISKIISNTHKGKVVSEETRRKLSEAQLRQKRPKTDEWKAEHSKKMMGKNNPMFGKHSNRGKTWKWTEESREKVKSKWHDNRELIECSMCKKSMHKSNFERWGHGDGCRR